MWTKKGQGVKLPSYRHPSKVHIRDGISVMATPLCILSENFNQQRHISTLRLMIRAPKTVEQIRTGILEIW